MAREFVAGLVIAAMCPACSLILDFSDKEIPKDAMIDAPYTQPECDYKEPNDTIPTAAPIDVATDMGPAAICASATEDHDFYQFTVPAATTTVTVSITFDVRPTGDLDLRLWDTAGNMISQSRGFGGGETIVCPGLAPACPTLVAGDYVFEVFPGIVGAVNAYSFAVQLQ